VVHACKNPNLQTFHCPNPSLRMQYLEIVLKLDSVYSAAKVEYELSKR
jgi:hypothetical protein